MATARQIAANRANSQKSTGPVTDEGKAKSSLNRLSHGLTSNATIVGTENPEEFKALLFDLMGEYEPATPTEQILVEKMALNQWLSLRGFRLQGEAFLDQALTKDGFGIPKTLGLLIRYQTSAERTFHKAHNELVKTQKERKKSEIGFESQNAAELSDHPSAKRKNEPITVEVTWDEPDFPAESAPSVAPEAQPVPEFIKNVA
jgi:hypothetical protein